MAVWPAWPQPFHLAQAGFEVTCLELSRSFDRLVGESLDWSAPDLFKDLGLPMEDTWWKPEFQPSSGT